MRPTICKTLMVGIVLVFLTATTAPGQMKVGFQTGVINILLMVAQGKGLFEKEGLAIDLVPFPAGPSMLPALAAKEVDIAWMGEFPAVTGYSNRLPLQVFMFEQDLKTDIRFVALPDSGIKTISDLKRKKVGVTFGSSGHFHILQALSKAGLGQEDVTLVNLQPANMLGAFVAKQVDAVVTWEPHIGKAEEQGGVRIATTESIGMITLGIWVGRTEYIASKPDEIQKFLRAWAKAQKEYKADRMGCLEYPAKRLNMPVSEMAAMNDRQKTIHPTFKEQLKAEYLGQPGEELTSRFMGHARGVADFLVMLKRIEAAPSDWSKFVNVQPLYTCVRSMGD